jgi:hypothetical protein
MGNLNVTHRKILWKIHVTHLDAGSIGMQSALCDVGYVPEVEVVMDREPRLDIFSGTIDESPVWMEAVRGMVRARQRMNEMAEEAPGKYFIFSTFSHTILAITDTTRQRTKELRQVVRGAA